MPLTSVYLGICFFLYENCLVNELVDTLSTSLSHSQSRYMP